MTTITNFLHSTFLTSQHSDNEKPVWIIDSPVAIPIQPIKQYMIDHSAIMPKVFVHVDFGIGIHRIIRDAWKKYKLIDGLEIVVVEEKKSYIVVCVSSTLRIDRVKCLQAVSTALVNLSNTLQNYLPITMNTKSSISLLVQNLQIMSTKNAEKQNACLEIFINQLGSLSASYKQITVLKYNEPGLLQPEHEFALERLSTCLSKFETWNQTDKEWIVRSTIRRHTGYSNQEVYQIKLIAGKLKIQKFTLKKQDPNKIQEELLNNLGFIGKKTENQDKNNLKQMIYPHLRMQNKCGNCQKSQCYCQSRPQDEGLIILDDEQEDDDDIDV